MAKLKISCITTHQAALLKYTVRTTDIHVYKHIDYFSYASMVGSQNTPQNHSLRVEKNTFQ